MRSYFGTQVPLGQSKSATYLAVGLAEVSDLMEAGAWLQAEALVCLLLVATEQAALDSWNWTTGWLLTHLPEPTWHTCQFQPRNDAVRPLSRLGDPSWTAAALAYKRDVAMVLEARGPKPPKGPPARPPKGTKGGAQAEQSEGK